MNATLKEIFERSIKEKQLKYITMVANSLIEDDGGSTGAWEHLADRVKSRNRGYIAEIGTTDLSRYYKSYVVKWVGGKQPEVFRVTVFGPHDVEAWRMW